MRFILLVEGETERGSVAAFLKRWLDPRLKQPVGIQVVAFDGFAELIREMPVKARMHLEGPKKDEIIAVIALLDLYGPKFYPADKVSAEKRFTWAKDHFEKKVDLEKFHLFFAVHEFEAWLLSQPAIFRQEVKDALPPSISQPERVNFDEPPAKLLNRIYKQKTGRNYKKTVYGKQLFDRLDPAIAYDKCPYLKSLLDTMLSLANAAKL